MKFRKSNQQTKETLSADNFLTTGFEKSELMMDCVHQNSCIGTETKYTNLTIHFLIIFQFFSQVKHNTNEEQDWKKLDNISNMNR